MSGNNGAMQNPTFLTKVLATLRSGEHVLTLTATEERSPDEKSRCIEVLAVATPGSGRLLNGLPGY